jgi:LysR family glycine cleavage system transcriptional activator
LRRLPFLNGVRAFEAAARRGSFAAAADELSVTPAAVSRMVKLLEERLETPLFNRHANGLSLTQPGAAYAAGLSPLLDELAALTDRVTARGSTTLTVGVGPTFAVRWLIPRLGDFQQAAPGIDVHIATGGAAAPFNDDWTCGVALGGGNWPGLAAEKLFEADLTPVCTTATAAGISDPADLARGPLLRVAHAADDWPRWLAAAGAPQVAAAGPELGFYGQAMQAAMDGVGVAMGIRPYIDDDLAAGRLVAPFALSIPKGGAWYLVYREARRGEPAFDAFRKWLKEGAAA